MQKPSPNPEPNPEPSAPSSPDYPNHDTEPQTIGRGVTKQWIDNGSILLMKFEHPHRDSIDAWANELLRLMENWPEGKPFLSLQDQSDDSMTVTPYMRQRASEVDAASKKLAHNGKLAMVLPRSITSHIVRLVAEGFGRSNRSVKRRFFMNTEEALAWLRKGVE